MIYIRFSTKRSRKRKVPRTDRTAAETAVGNLYIHRAPAMNLLLKARHTFTSNRVMPFLLGALVTAIFFQTSNLGALFSTDSGGIEAAVQESSLEVNKTRVDALFQKLWKETEGQVWMSKEEAQMVVRYLGPEQTMWEWGRQVAFQTVLEIAVRFLNERFCGLKSSRNWSGS